VEVAEVEEAVLVFREAGVFFFFGVGVGLGTGGLVFGGLVLYFLKSGGC